MSPDDNVDEFPVGELPDMNAEVRVAPSSECISVIVPTLNECATLLSAIGSIEGVSNVEVVVVDGGSHDETKALAGSCGARVLCSPSGRARQMNFGASAASGEILLFLHADTCLPKNFDSWIRQTLSRPGTVAGAFELRLNARMRGLRVIESLANWRSRRLQMPYGDQGIFLKADRFQAVGGFPEIPIMEDFELMRRLRRQGRVEIIPLPVFTSARRWQERGVWKTTLMNQIAIAAYCLGVEPERIARWYYQGCKPRRELMNQLDTTKVTVPDLRN